MDHGAQPLGHGRRVGFHVTADPFQRHAHQSVLVKVHHELLVGILDRDVLALAVGILLQRGVQQFIKILFHLLAAHRTVNIQHKGLVLLQPLQNVQKCLVPGLKALSALQDLGGVLHKDPVHQIVDVFEMIIEGHTVHTAVLGNVVDRDLVEGLLEQQLFERCLQRPLGRL